MLDWHIVSMSMSREAVHTLELTIDEKDLRVTIDNQLKGQQDFGIP